MFDAFAKPRTQWNGEHAKFNDGRIIHAPVGTYKPDAFGLYDVHGNVWEWCLNFYSSASASRVYRGGSFGNEARIVRSANRDDTAPTIRSGNLGLRAARALH